MREREIERKLVDGVKAAGGLAYKFVSPGCTGVPDRIVILPGGKVCFAELKADNGRLSGMQAHQITQLRRMGCEVRVVRGLQGVREFLEEIRNEV